MAFNCCAEDYLTQLEELVSQSQNKDWGHNKNLVFNSLADIKSGRYPETSENYIKQCKYLDDLESRGIKYISVALTYDSAKFIDTYLITETKLSDIPKDTFKWYNTYNPTVFSQL